LSQRSKPLRVSFNRVPAATAHKVVITILKSTTWQVLKPALQRRDAPKNLRKLRKLSPIEAIQGTAASYRRPLVKIHSRFY